MKRLSYIYLLAPLYTILGFLPAIGTWCGTYGTLAIGTIFSIAVWAVVWLRLYGGDGKMRPEFAVLSVLPIFCYLGLKTAGEQTARMFDTPAWQNTYFLTWLACSVVLILSMVRNSQDGEPRKWTQDGTLHLMTLIILLYTVSSWAGSAPDIFPSISH